MKKLIRLTEGDLHKIIENSVKRILKESGGKLTPKQYDMWRDWNDIDRDPRYGYYYPQGKNNNGYQDEFEIPSEELELYKSMGNPSQYATKGEFARRFPNKNGGYHESPLRWDQGDLSMAAQTKPTYDSYDKSEEPATWSDNDGSNYVGVTPSYAKNHHNFQGNQDMHDLEANRINRENWEADHELDGIMPPDEGY